MTRTSNANPSKPCLIGGVWYSSQTEAAKALGVNSRGISQAIKFGHKVKGMRADHAEKRKG